MGQERSESGNLRGDVFTEEIGLEHSSQGWSSEGWCDQELGSTRENSPLSGSRATRNAAATLICHQIPPWPLEEIPLWNRGVGGGGGLLVSQIPEGISLTCPLIQWPLRLVDVTLAAGLPLPQPLLVCHVATPQFSALKTILERSTLMQVGINRC